MPHFLGKGIFGGTLCNCKGIRTVARAVWNPLQSPKSQLIAVQGTTGGEIEGSDGRRQKPSARAETGGKSWPRAGTGSCLRQPLGSSHIREFSTHSCRCIKLCSGTGVIWEVLHSDQVREPRIWKENESVAIPAKSIPASLKGWWSLR